MNHPYVNLIATITNPHCDDGGTKGRIVAVNREGFATLLLPNGRHVELHLTELAVDYDAAERAMLAAVPAPVANIATE